MVWSVWLDRSGGGKQGRRNYTKTSSKPPVWKPLEQTRVLFLVSLQQELLTSPNFWLFSLKFCKEAALNCSLGLQIFLSDALTLSSVCAHGGGGPQPVPGVELCFRSHDQGQTLGFD